jgi:serine/threonine protein kinase
MIGETILHYNIKEKLGEGGMGIVYLAEDTKLKRPVAIKFLPRHIAVESEERERFKLEAQAAAALNHPNISHIYAIEEHGEDTFIVMEYIDGQELKSVVGAGSQPAHKTDEIVNIAIQIAEGLQAAHEKQIVHRDIKSANIMINEKGRVKIMDFGLAKVRGVAQVTKQGTTLGTTTYMSPEQAQGNEVDHRTDIWSFGVVLYEMISGKLPFKGDYEQAVIYAILNDQPEQLRNLRDDVPEVLENIVTKSLVKDPSERYQTVEEIINELRLIQREQEPPGSSSISSSVQPVDSNKKKKYNFIYIGVSMILIVAILWYLVFPPGQDTHNGKSIAVLPFKNLSEDQENEFFSDGVTEDIISQLSKISDLRVISRTSIMRYKNNTKSMREIGKELNVTNILEGSVRRADNQVRIVATLIDAESDEQVWNDTYDKELTQIFEIQSDVAKQIAAALKTRLSPEEKERIEKKSTDNLDAYTYYLKGRQYYNLYQQEANETAIELFKKALEIDPNYGLAYAGLGDCYGQRTNKFGFSSDWIDSAIVVSEKAISLDPDLAEGYKALGLAYQELGWYRKAMEANEKAIELNPNYSPAVGNLGWGKFFLGELDEAMVWLKKSANLSPSNAFSYFGIGICYLHMNDTKNAVKYYLRALELQPNLPAANWGLVNAYITDRKYNEAREVSDNLPASMDELTRLRLRASIEYFFGNLDEAKPHFDKTFELYPDLRQLEVISQLFTVYWKLGERDKAEKYFEILLNRTHNEINRGSEDPRIRYNLAGNYAARGNKQEAYKWLQEAIDLGFNQHHFAEIDPAMESLYEDAQFQNMMADLEKRLIEIRANVKNLDM